MPESKNVDEGLEMSALIEPYHAFVTYVPLRSEVPFQDYCPLPKTANIYEIAPRASLDPSKVALDVLHFLPANTCILLPGRRFDAFGTRLGQGGGWYDRFLARVPSSWLRIGFCFDDQFTTKRLPHAIWDQSVDVVCVIHRKTRKPTLYRTNARI